MYCSKPSAVLTLMESMNGVAARFDVGVPLSKFQELHN